MSETSRILLGDDHVLFRQNLKRVLVETGKWQVVGEAKDGREVLDLMDRLTLSQLSPHLVILDLSMPILWGIETTRQIKMRYPGMNVLILSIHEDREFLDQALMAGAKGFLVKKDTDAELFPAIERIMQGDVYVSSHFSNKNHSRSANSPERKMAKPGDR